MARIRPLLGALGVGGSALLAMPALAVTGFHLHADGTPFIASGQVVECPSEAGGGRYLKSWRSTGNKQIRGTCGANGLYQETWTAWHENGEKKWKADFVDGLPVGRFRSWHDNGQRHAAVDWLEGRPHGEYDSWYDNGQKAAEGTYLEGEPHGCYESYYADGGRKEKGAYSRGEKVGKWFYWDSSGERRKEIYGGEVEDGCLVML